MIELAPSHKRGLALANPVMNAAGTLGFADEYRGLIDFARLGAFVTNPLTFKPRTPARGEHVVVHPHGVLIHTGLPNPGVSRGIRQFARAWASMPCPAIVHVAATTPADVAGCLERLDRVEAVDGVELGLRDDIAAADAEALVAAAVGSGSLPVVVRVPLESAVPIARAAARAGAQALTVAAPPRGSLALPPPPPDVPEFNPGTSEERREREAASGRARWITGRLYGPAQHARALLAIREVAAGGTGLPIVGCGGIHSWADAHHMLLAGAAAIQLDSVNWLEPRLMETLAESPIIRDWGMGRGGEEP